MRKTLAFSSLLLLFMVPVAGGAVVESKPKTLFHYAEKAWAVGVVRLGKPLETGGSKVIVFPGQITDLVWAPEGTRPRNLMLVHDTATDEKNDPSFREGDEFLAPIRRLSENAYWRENLPRTPRHQVAGGRRYAFRGEQIPVVKKLLADFLAATERKGQDRWTGQFVAVAAALDTNVRIVREDAAGYLSTLTTLARDFDERALPSITAYLSGDAPAEEKASLINALTAAKIAAMKPVLVTLSSREDSTGAAAMRGLDLLGESPSTDRLLALSRSSSMETRAYAAEALGRRAATDDAALARAREMLADNGEHATVLGGLCSGLGAAGGSKAIAVLRVAVEAGKGASRPAAAAIAQIGGPESEAVLIQILKEKEGDPAIAAAAALGRMDPCSQCGVVLHEQHEKHPDEAVRSLIGMVLEVPAEHKH